MVLGASRKQQRGGSRPEQDKGEDGPNILRDFIECVEARRSAREQRIPRSTRSPGRSDPRRVEEPD